MKCQVQFDKLRLNLLSIVNGLENVVDQALTAAAEKGAQIARDQAEYISHSQDGLKSATQAYRDDSFHHGIIAKKRYAQWVEYGNGPINGRIFPKSKKALRFVVNGKTIFAKSVKASQPKPYMSKAVKFEEENLTKIIAWHIKNKLYLK